MIDVVKIPITYRGTRNTALAPEAILTEMKHVWGNETGKAIDEYTVYEWEKWKIQESGNRVIFLGGDHSTTLSTFPRIKAGHLIVLDAHFDLHGSLENNRPFHGNWLKIFVEKGIVNPRDVTILGVRAWEMQELEYANAKNINYIPIDYPSRIDLPNKPIYLSIDIDVVDPAYAPGTGYMEPGGWSSRNLLEIVKTLRTANLMAMDIVEIDPTRDINNMTSKLAAKVIKEFL